MSTINYPGDTAIQRYSDTAIQRYSDTAIQRYSDTAIQRYSDTAIQRYSDTAIQHRAMLCKIENVFLKAHRANYVCLMSFFDGKNYDFPVFK